MKYNLVYIFELDVMGHVDVENEPDYVYYVSNGFKHKILMDESQYMIVDSIEIEIEEYK